MCTINTINKLIQSLIFRTITLLITSITLIFLIVSCSYIPSKDNYGYKNLNKNDSILTMLNSVDETIEITSTGTKYLYIGWEKCPWCQRYVPYYNNILKENNIETLYYFSPYQIKGYVEKEENGNIMIDYKTEDYKKLVNWILSFDEDLSKNYLKTYSIKASNEQVFELPWLYVPRLYKIENGAITGVVGTLEGHSKNEEGIVSEFTKEQEELLISNITKLL